METVLGIHGNQSEMGTINMGLIGEKEGLLQEAMTSQQSRMVARKASFDMNEDIGPPIGKANDFEGDEELDDAVRVVVRIRPPLPRERKGLRPFENAVSVDPSARVITLSENLEAAAAGGVQDGIVYNTYRFVFDRIYSAETKQDHIYEDAAQKAVGNVLVGYNASIIAFGQTGSGKTYTMTGDLNSENCGIIPRAIEDVFAHIQRDTGERCKFLVRASYLQIYNEVISDLLKPASKNLSIREDRKRGVHVEGLSEWIVRSPSDVYKLMERGSIARATGATKMNEISSRSHAIFQLIIEKSVLEDLGDGQACDGDMAIAAALAGDEGTGAEAMRQTVRVGKLNLVDLAGSERVHVTGAKGKRLEESKKINQSLSALGNVIAALTDPKGRNARPHVPYRDSKLTRILEDSLGGNCKTTFMAMISPAVEAFSESLSTLKFAQRTKCVRNAPRVNEDLDHRTLLRKYEKELKKLRAELKERSKDLVDRRLVLHIEEARRREQADKIAAITALERQSAEIVRQKNAMKALQNRITSMQSQMLVGGHGLEHNPAFRTLLEKEHARMRKEYDKRVAELEAQRRAVKQDRAAAVKIRELMMKQRDIIHALLGRVGQLDARVLELQAAVEAADARAKEAEDRLDNKTAELIGLRKSFVVKNDSSDLRKDKECLGSSNHSVLALNDNPEKESLTCETNAIQCAEHRINCKDGAYSKDLAIGPGYHAATCDRPNVTTPISLKDLSSTIPAGPQEVEASFGRDTSSGSLTSRSDFDDDDCIANEDSNHEIDRSFSSTNKSEGEIIFANGAFEQSTKIKVEVDASDKTDMMQQAPMNEIGSTDSSREILENQNTHLKQERDALRAILQEKVLTLVENISNDRDINENIERNKIQRDDVALRFSNRQLEYSSELQQKLEYLHKLVSATVNALQTNVD